ncbi:hypothetical protein MTO96_049979 [Rhipicephalus appendiculatus]
MAPGAVSFLPGGCRYGGAGERRTVPKRLLMRKYTLRTSFKSSGSIILQGSGKPRKSKNSTRILVAARKEEVFLHGCW